MDFLQQTQNSRNKISNALELASSGKYELGKDGFKTNPFPGITVLANPYPITSNEQSDTLIEIQEAFSQIPIFCAIPSNSFHLTIADLAFGDSFTDLISSGRMQSLSSAVQDIFSRNQMTKTQCTISGIGHFGTVIAAVVTFNSEVEFKKIWNIRNAIYNHESLQQFTPTLPFIMHITLGYFCSSTTIDMGTYESDIEEIQKLSNQKIEQLNDASVIINGMGLFEFPNMDSYDNHPYSSFNLIADDF